MTPGTIGPPIGIEDAEWPACLELHEIPPPKGFLGKSPDGFFEPHNPTETRYETRRIYVKASVLAAAKRGERAARAFMFHEYGHAIDFPLEDHPDDFVGGWNHACQVGFDDRAYRGLFRLRQNADLRKAAAPWLNENVLGP